MSVQQPDEKRRVSRAELPEVFRDALMMEEDPKVLDGYPRRSPLWGKVHMAQFSVEIIRLPGSLLGGNQQCKVPIGPVFDAAISNLHAMAFATDDLPFYEVERKDITQAALRVIAESMATDNAARARRSKREQSLTQAIEEKIVSSETRSRENGWSYVENLTKRLGKWPPRKK